MAGVGCGDSPVAWLRIALITMPNPFRLTRLLPASVSLRSALGLMLGVASAYGAEIAPPALRAVDFDQEIRPLLENHCTDCHDGEKQKGQLRLDGVAGILKGGDSGEPLLIRGKSLESNIIRHVTSKNPKEVMPPKGDPLTLEEIGLLRAWIDAGAKMPGEAEAAQSLKLKTDHWSFQPLKRPAVPQGGDGFVRNAVDGFVLAKLKEKNLEPSPSADRSTLIRRLYLVMHGMPPAPQEVEAFVQDARPDAYPRLVDAVLASPRYGERWARHWMDVVRYADTNGFETNRERKTAYPYRDWLIASLNADKPYDQFLREQLAGDQLGADAATGFLVAGAYDLVRSPDVNLSLMQRQDELADMVNTTGTAFMGLTMGCARCHNHKFDPILQKDYYAMQAVFEGVNYGERPLRENADPAAAQELGSWQTKQAALQATLEGFRQKAAGMAEAGKWRPPVNAQKNEEILMPVDAVAVRFTIHATSGGEPCLDELEIHDASEKNVAPGGKPTASGTLPGYDIHRLEHLNDGKTGNDHSWISNTPGQGWVQIDFPAPMRLSRIIWSRDREGKLKDRLPVDYVIEAAAEPGKWMRVAGSDDRLPFDGGEAGNAFLTQLPAVEAGLARQVQADLAATTTRISQLKEASKAWVGTFGQPGRTSRLYRGEVTQPREVVAPDVLTVMGTLGMSPDEPESQRRLKFAHWITSPQHPLTARVMVNRLWHYIFGQGIVSTPGDFGKNGSPPSHPELLDWLADELVTSGWSLKAVQRQILLSAAFQQSAAPRAGALTADAGAQFLWRFPPRRMEAEAIRDAMLTVSGSLDLKMGGPGFYLMDVVEENVMHYFAKEKFTPAEFRRMVYQFRIRQTTDSVFSSLDCPDGGQVMPKRSRSNTPLQALNLFNSTFVVQQADLFAERLRQEAGEEPEAQSDRAFKLCYSRLPDAWERQQSAAFIRSEGLTSFCRALYNSSEFLFVF
jgi:hypothetical protein